MENTYHEQSTASKGERCPRCSSTDLQEREKYPHVGLYCATCNFWIRWIPKRARLKLASVAPAQHLTEGEPTLPLADEPGPDTCGHCPELDRVVDALNGVERELIIIVRALCNGAGR